MRVAGLLGEGVNMGGIKHTLNSDWQENTQNKEYLDLCVQRLNEPILTWVNQIANRLPENNIVLNDIGCNVGHFYRGIQSKNITYRGYDVSKTYLDIAKKNFGEYFYELDITKQIPETANITIISATLEHLENYKEALKNIFISTTNKVIIRTFVGYKSKINYKLKPQSKEPYVIHQFTKKQLNPHKIPLTVIKDEATKSKTYKMDNIKRRMKILEFDLNYES